MGGCISETFQLHVIEHVERYYSPITKKRKVYKARFSKYDMSTHKHKSISETLEATLIDGHLPSRDFLIERAARTAREVGKLPKHVQKSFMGSPYDWNEQTDDDLFTHIAYNTRGLLQRSLPSGKSHYIFNEAWPQSESMVKRV